MKTLTLKQLKNLVNESNEDNVRYIVDYISCRNTEDDYKDGEILNTTEVMDVDVPNMRYGKIEYALRYVCEKLIGFSWKKDEWFYFEDGRFYSDFLVNDKQTEPSSSEIEEWKRGERKLWNFHVDVSLSKVIEAKLDENDAAREGFSE